MTTERILAVMLILSLTLLCFGIAKVAKLERENKYLIYAVDAIHGIVDDGSDYFLDVTLETNEYQFFLESMRKSGHPMPDYTEWIELSDSIQ